MNEEFKFAGFSRDLTLFKQARRYWHITIEEMILDAPIPHNWSVVEALAERDFDIDPNVLSIWYRNEVLHKGVRVQQNDPLGEKGLELSLEVGTPYTTRPSSFLPFLDTVAEATAQFSNDLVVICELSCRTELLAKKLFHAYIVENVDCEKILENIRMVSEEQRSIEQRWRDRQR